MVTMKINNSIIHSFPFTIRPLSDEDRDGFMIESADLPGCVSDGDTPEAAMASRVATRSGLIFSVALKTATQIPKPAKPADSGGSVCLAISTPASSLGRGRRALGVNTL